MSRVWTWLVFLSIVSTCPSYRAVPAEKYSTRARREPHGNRLQIHIIPHSHDDSGWLKTFEQYYWGARQEIQQAAVQFVLDSVTSELMSNPHRRFTFAEMSFFKKWWEQQDEERHLQVKQLVERRRLNFVNGGYVQHDEATAHYVAQLDQTTVGHSFLRDTFNVTPSIGWQIDPFGHSSTQAGLFGASLGFDAVMFGRADYQDMARRRDLQELEMIWQGSGGGSPSSSSTGDVQNSVFAVNFGSGNYGPPPGFWWEWGPTPDPYIIDDPSSSEYNVPERVDTFVRRCMELANVTRGPDLLVTMGSDFHYGNAHVWFKNLDALIHYVNEDGRVNAFYSSPEDYVAAKAGYNTTWPLKTDDFFPYADSPHSYWTGYFTSRPNSKRYIREATSLLQAARQLEALFIEARSSDEDYELGSSVLEQAVALCQHHDAITGTARQHVVNDYHRQIHRGMIEALKVINMALTRLLLGPPSTGLQRRLHAKNLDVVGLHARGLEYTLTSCLWLNVSVCDATVGLSRHGEGILAVVYNPLAQKRTTPVRVPVDSSSACRWEINGPDGQPITSQLVPLWNESLALQQVLINVDATTKDGTADAEIVFQSDLPPLGYAAYQLEPVRDCRHDKPSEDGLKNNDDERKNPSISNGLITVQFDSLTGLASSLSYDDGRTLPFSAEFWWYNSSDGLDSMEDRGQSSGAYIFRPNGCYKVNPKRVRLDFVKGDTVEEARQVFDDWATLVTRLYKGQKHIEMEWTVGPVPWEDGYGREVILRYASGVNSGDNFWGDANGRTMLRRRRNFRPTWDLNVTEDVAGNYYPATSAAYIEDTDWQLAVITDRAQGFASLKSGEIEFMVHRRNLVDDRRGVSEPLNETICGCIACDCSGLIARGVHWIVGARASTAAKSRRALQQLLNDPPVLSFGSLPNLRRITGQNAYGLRRTFSATDGRSMHSALHLVTVLRSSPKHLLVRFAHLFDADEDSEYGVPVVVSNVGDLLRSYGCTGTVEEMTASGNQKLWEAEARRLQFRPRHEATNHSKDGSKRTLEQTSGGINFENWEMEVLPMELRTFEIEC